MKFRCKREKLVEAYAAASSFCGQRTIRPILQHVKVDLDSKTKTATLIGTDGDVGVRIQLHDLEDVTTGSLILPERFGNWLRESSDEFVSVDRQSSGLVVKGDRGTMKLQDQNPEEHPGVEPAGGDDFLAVGCSLLRAQIQRTVFSCDVDSSRFALGGICFEFKGDVLTAVATDGRRLATVAGVAESVGQNPLGGESVVVPARAAQLLDQALGNEPGTVHLSSAGNCLVVRTPNLQVSARLLEGRFPKWREVLPKLDGYSAVDLVAGPVSADLRQAAVVTEKESRGVTFEFSESELVMSCQTAGVGQTRVELPISFGGGKVPVVMDSSFVTQFLRQLDSAESFKIELRDGNSPVLFVSGEYRYVVMPLAKDQTS